MTIRDKPLAEHEQTIGLLMQARAEPQVLDLPRDDPWTIDYLEQLALRHPVGTKWVWDYLPRHAPQGWQILERGGDGLALAHVSGHLVLLTGGTYEGQRWLHMVVSAPESKVLPTFQAALGAKMALVPGLEGLIALPTPDRYPLDPGEGVHVWLPTGGLRACLPDFRDRFGRW